MRQKAFRLSDSQINKLKEVASERGCTESDVIRSLIDQLADDSRSGYDSDTEDGHMYDVILAQLAVKDEQIASLSRALESAQETAKAAQALQARATGGPLVLREGMTRWQRLRAAWSGK